MSLNNKMVKALIKNNSKLWVCEACSFAYKKKEVAKKCEAFCNKHHQCSLEIIRYAVK